MKAYLHINHSCLQIIQTEPNVAIIEELYVAPDERHHGVGTRMMKKTCKDADRENVTLLVKPYPFGSYDIETETYYPAGLTYKQLCHFYRTFGFRFRSKPFEDIMMRKPK